VLNRSLLWHGVGIALLLGVGTACYNYDPVPSGVPAPGSVVSTSLTDSGMFQLARYLGPEVEAVNGRVERLNADDLVLSVSTVRNRNGVEHYWKGEMVTLPRPVIARVEVRKLAIGRSVFCAVLGIGGAIEVLQAFGVTNTGQQTTSDVTKSR